MKIESIAVTNVGRVRKNNEDNFFVCGKYKTDTEITNFEYSYDMPNDCGLFGVCDGMGGMQYGEVASLIAVKSMSLCENSFESLYAECINSANAQICREIERYGGKRIGTTFAALSIRKGIARGYNIGDSRIYICRNGNLQQLSVDHTQAQMLVNQGILTEEQAKTHRDRHVLTQHLGIFPEEMIIEPHIIEPISIAESDIFLLCSDGLTDMVEDSEICNILSTEGDLKTKANCLVNTALENGGRDNVTVVIAYAAPTDKKKAHFDLIEEKMRSSISDNAGSAKEKLVKELMEKIKNKLE